MLLKPFVNLEENIDFRGSNKEDYDTGISR